MQTVAQLSRRETRPCIRITVTRKQKFGPNIIHRMAGLLDIRHRPDSLAQVQKHRKMRKLKRLRQLLHTGLQQVHLSVRQPPRQPRCRTRSSIPLFIFRQKARISLTRPNLWEQVSRQAGNSPILDTKHSRPAFQPLLLLLLPQEHSRMGFLKIELRQFAFGSLNFPPMRYQHIQVLNTPALEALPCPAQWGLL